jgi:hypothetical protein
MEKTGMEKTGMGSSIGKVASKRRLVLKVFHDLD